MEANSGKNWSPSRLCSLPPPWCEASHVGNRTYDSVQSVAF